MPTQTYDDDNPHTDDAWDYTDDDNNVEYVPCDTDTEYDDAASQHASYVCSSTLSPPPDRPPLVWKLLRLGESVLHVSSYGMIKPYRSLFGSSYGFAVAGTPFRSYPYLLDDGTMRHMYMHEIVWQAFRGAVPTGWEVRHKDRHTRIPRKVYSNAIWNLDMFPCLNA